MIEIIIKIDGVNPGMETCEECKELRQSWVSNTHCQYFCMLFPRYGEAMELNKNENLQPLRCKACRDAEKKAKQYLGFTWYSPSAAW